MILVSGKITFFSFNFKTVEEIGIRKERKDLNNSSMMASTNLSEVNQRQNNNPVVPYLTF